MTCLMKGKMVYILRVCLSLLKGHWHRDFAVWWSKLLKYLTKNHFSNKKLPLEHREENMKLFLRGRINCYQFLTSFPKHTRSCNPFPS